jgi:SAM-dependent methyltransferase
MVDGTNRPDDTAPGNPEEVVERVRERYGKIASGGGTCCGEAPLDRPDEIAGGIGYGEAELGAVPGGANLGLGCGAPVPLLDLQPGETVLDLGSGAGLDAFLAADRVGPQGRVIGVDMTPEMVRRARDLAAGSGRQNVEFREGRLEALPLKDGSVDAVTSNCVINLVPDKGKVFREIARVLRPGGRLVVADIVLDGALPPAVERDVLAWVGCVAGALQRETYFQAVGDAGFTDVTILKDVDYLEPTGGCLPPDLKAIQARAGLDPGDLRGTVRSVTFRAVRSA